MISRVGSEPSPRRWGFQPLSRPRKMSITATDCKIIMMCANSDDSTVSTSTPANKMKAAAKTAPLLRSMIART